MSIEIVTIGNELLSGMTRDANAYYLAGRLSIQGITPSRFTTIGDEESALYQGLQQALKRSNWVVCCGGLGPTVDDHTRSVVSEIFQVPLVQNLQVVEELNRRYGSQLIALEDQAMVPQGAEIFLNKTGTAPGFVMRSDQGGLIVLPGVPVEFQNLVDEQVLPWIERIGFTKKEEERVCLYLAQVSESQIDPYLRQIQEKYPEISLGIYPGIGQVRVQLAHKSQAVLESAVATIKESFSKNIYPCHLKTIQAALHTLLQKKKMQLAVAESCTGGKIAELLTQNPGASRSFLGGIVAYSDAVKMQFLGVSPSTLQKYGAVSEPVAEEMLEGILQKTGADCGIAVTGIAGPLGGSPDKPVGTVVVAVGCKNGQRHIVTNQHFLAPRNTIMDRAASKALFMLYSLMQE